MKSKFIQPEFVNILQTLTNDQEVATEISFENEKCADTFANIANQVVFDTTLDIEHGEEDITEKLRQAQAEEPNLDGLHIEVVGNRVTGRFPKELIETIDQCGGELGVKSICAQGPGGRRGRDWMLDL